ncbi:MAG: amino acid adenylation domain-containing protein [Acidobacteria bacterium]|nr:amino acid adenylation domain-containing protein [Acidobacteriota bacterium]
MSRTNLRFLDDTLEKERDYWSEKLSGDLVVTGLPADFPRPADFAGRTQFVGFEVAPETARRLAKLCGGRESLLFAVLVTALKICLHKYTGGEDILVGTTIHEQHGEVASLNRVLALRDRVSPSATVRQLLADVKGTLAEAYAHQKYPFDSVLDHLGVEYPANRAPLFNVAVLLSNINNREHLAELKTDLTVEFTSDAGGIRAAADYNPSLFKRETVELFARHYGRVLDAIPAAPDAEVSALDMLTPGERRRFLYDFNDTAREYPRRPVHALFEEQAARTPDAEALALADRSLTYAELNGRANRLARHLRASGVGPGARVGIYLRHSMDMVVGILAVLKAGGAYVPLEPQHPRPRTSMMVEDAKLALLLTQRELASPPPAGAENFLCLDDEWPALSDSYAGENLEDEVSPEETAYLIYTSGSTGKPKGVSIRHRSLTNYICWASEQYLRGEALDFALYSSLCFDLTVTSIFTPLVSGGRVVVYPTDGGESPLADILREGRVGVLKLTPSHLALVKDRDNSASGVRRLIVGGETLTRELARQVHDSFGGGVEIYNEYGPTEAAVGCMIYRYDAGRDDRAAVPVGRPAANTQVYVLDERLEPVAENVVGELYVGGEGVAAGYLGREDLTAERFLDNPFVAGGKMYRTGDLARRLTTGELEYLGRRDEQVKFHGYRVELGEIRAALNSHPQVRDSVIQLQKDAGGTLVMLAYYVSRNELDGAELRAFMAERIIEETIPNIFVHLRKLPLTLNGKVNHAALPTLEEVRGQVKRSFVAPRTGVEEELAAIWGEVLGVGQVGIEDNFFKLGGHSLLATQVLSRVREFFNVELPLRSLFESPTPGELAARVEAAIRAGRGLDAPPIEPVPRDEPLPLSFAQQRLWLFDQMEPGSHVYNVPGALRLSGRLNVPALEQSLNEIVRRHEVLRTTLAERDLSPVQVVAPQLTLGVKVKDLTGLPEPERERAAQRLAAESARLPFVLARGPLLRVELLRLAAEEHVLAFTLHHIVSDGWSMGIMVREFAALYEAFSQGRPSPLAELPVQYADFAVWQREWLRGEVLDRQLSYWKGQLGGAPTVLRLPTDRPRPPAQTFNGATERFTLPAQLSASLKALGRGHRATLFMTLLAAFQLLLHRYTGQEEIVVGTNIANRNRKETEGLIGFFVNNLVLRADFSAGKSFVGLLREARETCLGAYAHQDLPFELLMEELSLTPVEVGNRAARFDLMLNMRETAGGLAGALEYNTDLFERSTIARMVGHFETLLESVVENPEQDVDAVSMTREDEGRQLVHAFNDDLE